MDLTYFKTLDAYEAGRKFFNETLAKTIKEVTRKEIRLKDFLKEQIKSDNAFTKVELGYFLGTFAGEGLFGKTENTDLDKAINSDKYDDFLIFLIEVKGKENLTRSEIAKFTRALNRRAKDKPVILVSVYFSKEQSEANTKYICLSTAERSNYQNKNLAGEKIGKVNLLRDININSVHSGHERILLDLKNAIVKAVSMHDLFLKWREIFDIQTLNKRFYEEIFHWYAWAKTEVDFPNLLLDNKTKKATKSNLFSNEEEFVSMSVIRLLTRLFFVWFIKEKGLVDKELFDEKKVSEYLNEFKPENKGTTFYRAILQNLFFATLNNEMDHSSEEKTRYFAYSGGQERKKKSEFLVKNLYRYPDYFKIPKEQAVSLFSNVPFLNGGLFECQDKQIGDKEYLYLDGFTRQDAPEEEFNLKRKDGRAAKVPDFLFFGKERDFDISEELGEKKAKPVKVKGLIAILNSYKFTIEESTPIDEDVALDPELLSRIFENLLATFNPETSTSARKQTGSFYTPREIVGYMVDESLIAYLKTKLLAETIGQNVFGSNENVMFADTVHKKGQLGFTTAIETNKWKGKEESLEKSIRELLSYESIQPFDSDDSKKIIDAIRACKSLDPACGSGAFPMGMLHKMVHILEKLDPENNLWKEILLKYLDEEKKKMLSSIEEDKKTAGKLQAVEIREEAIKRLNEKRESVLKAFSANYPDYARKLYIIENCIYGVDIQPIAVQITKLRFFISLIVEQKINESEPNRGILPLPNLETRFVAANTLISLERPEGLNLTPHGLKELEMQLDTTRREYFNAKTRKRKLELMEEDKVKRKQISDLLKKSNFPKITADQIASWDPYDQNTHAEWFDAEYMFEILLGFDIVMGNPPYVQLQKIKEIANILEKQHFKTFTRAGDIYCLFYEKGIELLKTKGILSYITSNSWMRTQYGEPLRKLFWEKTNPLQLINFEDAQMFESAIVETNIFITMRDKNQNAMIAATVGNPLQIIESIQQGKITLSNLGTKSWSVGNLLGNIIQEKIEKKGILVKDIGVKINFGIKTGFNDAFIINTEIKNQLIKADKKNAKIIKPMVGGRDLKKYSYEWNGKWIINTHNGIREKNIPAINVKKDYPIIYEYLKEYKKQLEPRSDQGEHWTNLRHCAYIEDFDKPKIIWGEIADTSKFAYDDQGYLAEATAFIMTGANLKYLLSIFNSIASLWYFNIISTTTGMGTNRWKKYKIEQLPIPKSPIDNPELQKPLIALVDKILEAKRSDHLADTSKWENEIDARVFHLYGLTEDEMLTVLNSFPKMNDMEKLKIQNFYRDIENGVLKS